MRATVEIEVQKVTRSKVTAQGIEVRLDGSVTFWGKQVIRRGGRRYDGTAPIWLRKLMEECLDQWHPPLMEKSKTVVGTTGVIYEVASGGVHNGNKVLKLTHVEGDKRRDKLVRLDYSQEGIGNLKKFMRGSFKVCADNWEEWEKEREAGTLERGGVLQELQSTEREQCTVPDMLGQAERVAQEVQRGEEEGRSLHEMRSDSRVLREDPVPGVSG